MSIFYYISVESVFKDTKKPSTKSLDILNAFIHTYINIYRYIYIYEIRNTKYKIYACLCVRVWL